MCLDLELGDEWISNNDHMTCLVKVRFGFED